MSFVVSTDHLSKRYGGTTVVNDLNLRIPEGCVYGFLGPNGSGKSTTMKMLLSLIRPSSGTIEVFGEPMSRHSRRRLLGGIGSLIESPPGYGHLTGAENMRVVQRLLGLSDQQISFAVDTVRLGEQMNKKVRNYSLGMKQRLGIAMALARQPRLLILDEPTNGLDPAGIDEIRHLLRRLADGGVTVMVSSHLLGEIDKTANVLGILSGGQMLFQGTREELFTASMPDLRLSTADPRHTRSLLNSATDAHLEGGTVRVSSLDHAGASQLIRDLVNAGDEIYEARREEQSLEDVFMHLTTGGGL
ncbi:ABC transporter ATP-binding protein [Nesterenkonia lacusekhoensis]|uniref:ABC-2 type transport system ATP-binding protein n=1 Tax=Nesterenkonia lacusekhoensis TaxID=150832 RepID=A0ABS4T3X1_9MICC|nr:ABC transporter ATP-binding protein [Nesterenkonia lacusekhoensis]MBP2319142.1 ABC-2 type transport system ATP-binding protein [Nesterenkonia lacusekhoensis]